MATDFTQDTVLQFLQSRGGSVRNSDLLLHFRNFIRDHADRDRNRELFKRFVNSLATVQQIDGASYVVLRRKFRGHVPGGGGKGDSSEPPVRPTRKSSEPSREKAGLTSAAGAVKPQHTLQQREVITPAPPGVTAGKSILPAAGIMLNNNNNSMDTNLNLKHKQQEVINTQEEPVRPSVGVSHTPVLSQPPPQDQDPTVGQRRVGVGPPAGSTAGGPLRHTSQQVPEPLRPREASLQPQVRLHQDPPVLHAVPHAHVAPRRIRHRPSYKSAVSFDDDDDEEEEEEQVPVRRGSAGGAWPLSVPLGDMGRAISTSSPCIIDPPAPPSAASPSSSERMVPRIHIQNVKGEMVPPGGPGWSLESRVGQGGDWARLGPGPGPGSGPGPVVGSIPEDWTSTRRSLPFEAERYVPSPERAEEAPPCRAVQPEPRPGSGRSQRLSSSHSSIFSPSSNAGFPSSDWSLSGSPRGSEWNSSYEDLQARTGMSEGGAKTQEVVQRAQEPRFEFGGDGGVAVPRHRFIDHLHDDQESTAHLPQFHPALGRLEARANVLPWHLSTGDLCDDHEGAESSDGSTSSPPLRQRPGVARRLSSKLRSRMCRSMGADLDQVLQEVGGGEGGSEAARLNRLHLISSTLNLRYNLSSSSLSSCSTPPRCHSHADLLEGMEGGGGRRGSLSTASPSTAQHEAPSRQSLVPLEPREHTWLVKGAAGAWPDIYSLFREDSSLLNRRDFISGFTVLHWIAKHGDHRVLNTLWYGVEKAGLTFDVNAKSTCGHTPLHIAAIHGHKNIIRLLVGKFNANVRLRDTAGKKAWQYLDHTVSSDIYQLLGAPPQAARRGGGGAERVEPGREQQPQRRRRHYFSTASSGGRPLIISGTKVKRSTSIAALLKHKSLHRFHGHQSDSSI